MGFGLSVFDPIEIILLFFSQFHWMGGRVLAPAVVVETVGKIVADKLLVPGRDGWVLVQGLDGHAIRVNILSWYSTNHVSRVRKVMYWGYFASNA